MTMDIKTSLKTLSKEDFNAIYDEVEIKYRDTTKWMTREQLLFAALATGNIDQNKYNELI